VSLAINAEKQDSVQAWINKWLEQEQNGVKFPVNFDTVWRIAGYARKDIAKRKLSKMVEGVDLHRSVEVRKRPQGGTVEVEIFAMSCDAFKHFCLLAETKEGKEIRQYFIECEKKWKLVQQHHPEVANEVEILHLKLQLAQAEAQKAIAEKAILDTRHLIVSTCPEPVQQKIFGYEVVKEIEYRDRIIHNKQLIHDGETLTKTELCKRYGFIHPKSGKPNYTQLNDYLTRIKLPSQAWELKARIQDTQELRREYLPELDRLLIDGDRQMWIGENHAH
jgi:phage anti-repressor protein